MKGNESKGLECGAVKIMCDVVSEVTGISKFRTNLFCQVSSSVAVAVS